jgi:hypothetical protein
MKFWNLLKMGNPQFTWIKEVRILKILNNSLKWWWVQQLNLEAV